MYDLVINFQRKVLDMSICLNSHLNGFSNLLATKDRWVVLSERSIHKFQLLPFFIQIGKTVIHRIDELI